MSPPATRNRCRGSTGSERVSSTSRSWGTGARSSVPTVREDRRVVDEVEVVEHEHDRVGQLLEPGDQAAKRLLLGAEPGDQPGQGVVGRQR